MAWPKGVPRKKAEVPPIAVVNEPAPDGATVAPINPEPADFSDPENISAAYKRRELTNLDVARLILSRINDTIGLCEDTQMPMSATIQLNSAKRCIVGRIREKEFGWFGSKKGRMTVEEIQQLFRAALANKVANVKVGDMEFTLSPYAWPQDLPRPDAEPPGVAPDPLLEQFKRLQMQRTPYPEDPTHPANGLNFADLMGKGIPQDPGA